MWFRSHLFPFSNKLYLNLLQEESALLSDIFTRGRHKPISVQEAYDPFLCYQEVFAYTLTPLLQILSLRDLMLPITFLSFLSWAANSCLHLCLSIFKFLGSLVSQQFCTEIQLSNRYLTFNALPNN